MDTTPNLLETLKELDAAHDELLEQLDVLEKRVAKVLSECAPSKKQQPLATPAKAA